MAILKSLRHPNIIGYQESFLLDDKDHEKGERNIIGPQLVIIMEYATHGDLKEKRT